MPLLPTPGAGVDAERIKAKRRSRCKTCGHLTVKPFDEDPEGHNFTAHDTAAAVESIF